MTEPGMPLTHPGASVRDSMEAMGWTVTECARRLRTPRGSLSRLLNGHIGISPAMALALERIGWCAHRSKSEPKHRSSFDPPKQFRRKVAEAAEEGEGVAGEGAESPVEMWITFLGRARWSGRDRGRAPLTK